MKLLKKMYMLHWLEKLMLLILRNVLTKQIMTLRSKIFTIKYLVLLTTAILNAVKNKIPDVSALVEKADYDDK